MIIVTEVMVIDTMMIVTNVMGMTMTLMIVELYMMHTITTKQHYGYHPSTTYRLTHAYE